MPLNFDKQAQKGNQFLNQLAKELGNEKDKIEAGRVLRAVLYTLRDHLTLTENFHLLAQLPIALKGLYVDCWAPTHSREVTRKRMDFIQKVLAYRNKNKWADIKDIENTLKEVYAVFRTLKLYVSQGEFKKMEAVLPRQLKKLMRESLASKGVSFKLAIESLS